MRGPLCAALAALLCAARPYEAPPVRFLFYYSGGFEACVEAADASVVGFEIFGRVDGGDRFEGNGTRVGDLLVYRNSSTAIREGDEVRYWLLVRRGDLGYPTGDLVEKATRLVSSDSRCVESDAPEPAPACDRPSVTLHSSVAGVPRRPCVGDVVFEDRFDGKFLDPDKWTTEIAFASETEAEFVSYEKTGVYVEDSKLVVFLADRNRANLQTGALNLDRCTVKKRCKAETRTGGDILPPLVSGWITTRRSFNFRYGKVEIGATLPVGDWIYPQLYLRPQTERGPGHYDSGEMRVATVRGNRRLFGGSEPFGNSVLYGGVVLNEPDVCPRSGLVRNVNVDSDWGDAYRVYGLEWTEDAVRMSVDGKQYGVVRAADKYHADCPGNWSARDMKPFDEKFYLSIGLAVGGLTEFPDDVEGKPWRDDDGKPMTRFWRKKNEWSKTWERNRTRLVVDFVKVTAV